MSSYRLFVIWLEIQLLREVKKRCLSHVSLMGEGTELTRGRLEGFYLFFSAGLGATGDPPGGT